MIHVLKWTVYSVLEGWIENRIYILVLGQGLKLAV